MSTALGAEPVLDLAIPDVDHTVMWVAMHDTTREASVHWTLDTVTPHPAYPFRGRASFGTPMSRELSWSETLKYVLRVPPGQGRTWRLVKPTFADALLSGRGGSYVFMYPEDDPRQTFIDSDWVTQDLPVSQAGYLYQEPYAWLHHVARLAASVDHDYRDHWVQLGTPSTHTLYPDASHSINSQIRNANVLLWARALIGYVYKQMRAWEALDTAGTEWGTDAKIAEMRTLFEQLCDATVGCGPHWLRQWTRRHNPLTWRAKLLEYKITTAETSTSEWEPGDLIATVTGEGDASMDWYGPLLESYARAVDYYDTELAEAH